MRIIKRGTPLPPATFYFSCVRCGCQWSQTADEIITLQDHGLVRCPEEGCDGPVPAPVGGVGEGSTLPQPRRDGGG